MVADKKKAVERLGLPEDQADDPGEELETATDAPASKYGTTTATFVNVSTGTVRSVIVVKRAPWFSFERGNAIGGSVGISSTDGQIYRGYFRRDVAQIKGVYLQAEVEGVKRPGKPEGVGWVNVEYRW